MSHLKVELHRNHLYRGEPPLVLVIERDPDDRLADQVAVRVAGDDALWLSRAQLAALATAAGSLPPAPQ